MITALGVGGSRVAGWLTRPVAATCLVDPMLGKDASCPALRIGPRHGGRSEPLRPDVVWLAGAVAVITANARTGYEVRHVAADSARCAGLRCVGNGSGPGSRRAARHSVRELRTVHVSAAVVDQWMDPSRGVKTVCALGSDRHLCTVTMGSTHPPTR